MPNLLIIDDDSSLTDMLRFHFTSVNWDVTESDGEARDRACRVNDARCHLAGHAAARHGWIGLVAAAQGASVHGIGHHHDRVGDHLEYLLPKEIAGMRLEATPEKANLVAGGAVKRLGELELDYILDVLKAQNGNQSVTARMLGIARSTLQEKLKKYGIEERP